MMDTRTTMHRGTGRLLLVAVLFALLALPGLASDVPVLAGQYELSGRVLTVELKGKALVVMVPGQPVHDLVPAVLGRV